MKNHGHVVVILFLSLLVLNSVHSQGLSGSSGSNPGISSSGSSGQGLSGSQGQSSYSNQEQSHESSSKSSQIPQVSVTAEGEGFAKFTMLDPESGESYETTVKLDPEFFRTVYRDHFAPPYYLTPLDGKSPPIVVTPSPPFSYYIPEKLILPTDTDDAYLNSLLQEIRNKEVKISQQDDLIKKYEKLVALQDIEIANLKQAIADVTIPTPTEVPNAANN